MAKKKDGKMAFTVQGWDALHYKQTEGYVQAVDAIYQEAIKDFTKLAGSVKVNPDKPFSFRDHPGAGKKAAEITSQLVGKMTSVIKTGEREQWLFANKKNDAFLKSILKTSQLDKGTLKMLQDRNLDALKNFQGRKIAGLGLSDRIWNYAGQMKDQMELGIDIGLGDGRSANDLSRDLREYLVEPDKLFRRVRDKHGNLVLSKNAKAFHPGAGKYRSSYKNAMRLTRTEINMAYREADQIRWQKLDFVVGYEVRRSPKDYDCPVCDALRGKYPKTFRFVGWHPQCRCHAIPILQDPDEFNTDELNELKAALNGTNYKKFQSRNTVTDVPDNFKKWIADHAERSAGWNSQPYFIRQNFDGGKIAGGLRLDIPIPVVPKKVKPVKTEEQKQAIRKAWSARAEEVKKVTEAYQALSKSGFHPDDIPVGLIWKMLKNGTPRSKIMAEIEALNDHIWEIEGEALTIGVLIDDPLDAIKTHGLEKVKQSYEAVQNKLKEIDQLQPEEQIKKLKFEIDFVESKKKYSTWELAQKAYKKKLTTVEYSFEKSKILDSLKDSFELAAISKSTQFTDLVDDLKSAINYDEPISVIQTKADAVLEYTKKLKAAKASRAKKKGTAAPSELGKDPDAYSQARKDAALWGKTPREVDDKLRGPTGEVWQDATQAEREAAYFYTHTYSSINEPLRGIPYYGSKSLKVAQSKVPHLTSIISKSTFDFDVWLQRGIDYGALKGMFGIDVTFMTASERANALMGKVGVDNGFISCGSAKGHGYSKPVIMNIYCPRGTRMLYAEPFSQYGKGTQSPNWDGISGQSSFGSEFETILQRGTHFRVTKVENTGYEIYLDVEVIQQDN